MKLSMFLTEDENGEFSQPSKTGIYFHGFAKPEYLLKALENKKFGRRLMTSVAIPSSNVPYFYRIWFKPINIKLIPIFYRKSGSYERDPHLENQWGYKSEQEWIYEGEIEFKDIEIVKITIPPRLYDLYKNVCDKIRHKCRELRLPFTKGYWRPE